jgi:hypothetical protein
MEKIESLNSISITKNSCALQGSRAGKPQHAGQEPGGSLEG